MIQQLGDVILPEGYRIIRGVVVDGTGNGDELFGFILQRWDRREKRRHWYSYKKVTVWSWHYLSKSNPFEHDDACELRHLEAMAWLIHKTSPVTC